MTRLARVGSVCWSRTVAIEAASNAQSLQYGAVVGEGFLDPDLVQAPLGDRAFAGIALPVQRRHADDRFAMNFAEPSKADDADPHVVPGLVSSASIGTTAGYSRARTVPASIRAP
jgi:hypothetical protein